MTTTLMQIPAPSTLAALPGWVYAVGAVMGSVGFWGWMKVVTSKRYGLVETFLKRVGDLEQQVGGLRAELRQVQTEKAELKQLIETQKQHIDWLQAVSLRQINEYRRQLSKPPLPAWPPKSGPVATFTDEDEPK